MRFFNSEVKPKLWCAGCNHRLKPKKGVYPKVCPRCDHPYGAHPEPTKPEHWK